MKRPSWFARTRKRCDARYRHVGPTIRLAVMLVVVSSPAVHAQDATRDVAVVMDRFLEAFSMRDVAAFTELMTDSATMFFPEAAGQPAKRVMGRNRIRQEFTALYERAGPRRNPTSLIEPQDLLIQVFGTSAVVTFHLGSDESRGRRTFVLHRFPDGWRIVHVHSSTAGAN